MEPAVFISTGAFGRKSIREILHLAAENGIQNIELSSDACYDESMLPDITSAKKDFRFLVHNYFPTPAQPFVLNLASNDPKILRLSRNHCKRAVDLCARLDAPFYSVHAGFRFHAGPEDLGHELRNLTAFGEDEALGIFVESISELADDAALHGVQIAIENNVLASFNLRSGANELLLGVTGQDLQRILKRINRSNVGILLDVAHLKVSSNALGFDPVSFIQELAPRTLAVHLSDNDGLSDSNQIVTEGSWFWKPLRDYLPRNPFWILEAYGLPLGVIFEQIQIISSQISMIAKS